MSAMPDLFAPAALPRIETPAARASDPDTSHMAATAITASGKRQHQIEEVYAALKRNPFATSAEIGVAVATARRASGARDVDEQACRFMAARRLPDLRTAQRAENGGSRKCNVCGNPSLTWRAL